MREASYQEPEMREAAVKVMRRDKMSTDEECDRMSNAGTWGNTKAIEAISRMLGRQITVVMMDPRVMLRRDWSSTQSKGCCLQSWRQHGSFKVSLHAVTVAWR